MTRGLIASENIVGHTTQTYTSQWYPLSASYMSLDIEVSNMISRANFGFTFSEDKIVLFKYEPPMGLVFKKESIDLQRFSSAKYFRVSASNIGEQVSSVIAQPYNFDYKVYYSTERSNSPVYISALSGIGNFTAGSTYNTPWVNTAGVNNIRVQFFNNTEAVNFIVQQSESADPSELVKTETTNVLISTSLVKNIEPVASFIRFQILATIASEALLNTFF